MRKIALVVAMVFGALPVFHSTAMGGPDKYLGDTAIYSGSSQYLKPNVLLVIDNNRAMDATTSTARAYTSADYPVTGSKTSGQVYKSTSLGHYTSFQPLSVIQTNCPAEYQQLWETGFAFGYLDNYRNGCVKKNKNDSPGNFYLGDKLNYEDSSPTSDQTAIAQVQEAVIFAANATKEYVKFGAMVFGGNNKGGSVWYKVADISAQTFNGSSAFEQSINAIDDNLVTGNHQPLGELVWDAGTYLGGRYGTDSITDNSHLPGPYPSPMEESCQKNIIIAIAMGGAVGEKFLDDKIGDIGLPPDSNVLVDDAAKYLAENDLHPTLDGDQYAKTTIIQVFNTETPILQKAANKYNGQGKYYNVRDKDELVQAILDSIGNAVREANTGFVAPVVPASPENRTFSGKRIYLGFFYPQSEKPWWGNLKKFGLDGDSGITSVDGSSATNPDGGFKSSARSYWSTEDDSGEVDKGGLGGVLKARNIVPTNVAASDPLTTATEPRNIYTYLGSSADLTATSNRFTIGNAGVTTALLDVADATERKNLISFLHGIDAYDDDADTLTNEKRQWPMGDILHSKPLIVNYEKYAFSASSEADCSQNKTYIFVGANDGMLHAFRDCDGKEAWGFIPPGLLPNLRHLRENSHTYFVDGTPVAYIHDADNDGNIEAANGDKVIMIFGTRRGGGLDTLPASGPRGAYYALDVTNPASPQFMWRLDSDNLIKPGATAASSGLGELGETWSQPRLGKVKIGSAQKVVAFIGAGYDNNEDLRFGSTQTFPTGTTATTNVSLPTGDFLNGKSSDGGSAVNSRGRGIYVIEVAELSGTPGSFVPSFSNSGTKVWGYTHAENSAMAFSIPSDLLTLDRNYDGFIDRIYVGDTGGNMWKFNVGNSSTGLWTAAKIFSSNPGIEDTPTNGRKIFYKPEALVTDHDTTLLYFGTGDRAHPQNYLDPGASGAVVDRLYALRDTDNDTNLLKPTVLTETNLVDVTTNQLQQDFADPDDTTFATIYNQLYNDPTKYGWFIRLDTYGGEKSLATASVFNNVALYTTYTPNVVANVDPCSPGNPGTARIYAVNPKTGEAVFNFFTETGTDQYGEDQAASTNERSLREDDAGNPFVLRRADRHKTIGGGIPTDPVYTDGSVLIGSDASFPKIDVDKSGAIFPIYWMQW
ncbi:type IV pilin PilY [Desulfuromonas versatilis]|uniref:Type IV pilin PilY n=1 Tax=Desulfuromonas versatilis TaxID=2802975 RepID=A0ABM8HVU1_9BACT|nr:PilC/PilY family type IV pilus protein [Desulfuromonas versatilis]BCR04640.1 type IV pilin PilY [Desulfuromonas versatilis]